jgi:hypothetical protein
MKRSVATACVCLAFLASTGFCQITNSPITTQMGGGSARFGLDGQLISGVVTFNPPVLAVMTVTEAPYCAVEIAEQTRTLPDGTRMTQAMPSTRICRDSAGRTRTERPALLPMPTMKASTNMPVIAEICDPVAGYQYFLDAVNRVAHRFSIPPSLRNARFPAAIGPIPITGLDGNPQTGAPAFTNEPLGTQMIEGVLAEGRRTTATYAAGTMGNDKPIVNTTETWNSVDLKITVLSRSNDPRSGESIRALVNINRSEPDSRQFQVPPDYTVKEETGSFTITFAGPRS